MVDYLWLHDENEIPLYNACKDAIDAANYLFEPGNKAGDIVISTLAFQKSLYLLKAYLEVDLWVHPCGKPFAYNYFIFAEHILKELCVRGVLVISGNFMNTISSLEIAIVVHDNAIESLLEMLIIIHTLDINVWVESYKGFTMLGHFSFVNEDSTRLASNIETQIRYVHVGMCGLHPSICNKAKSMEAQASLTHTLVRINFVSTSQLVEDVFLKYWIPYNAEYGGMNNNIKNII